MPIPPLVAAGIVARRAALSAARKGKGAAKRKFKRDGKWAGKIQGEPGADARKKITWFEIIAVVLLVALPNDLLDIINLTGVGKLVTIFIEPITLFFLFAWFWIRVREKSSRKVVKNAVTFLAEILPIMGLLPLWTLLVINVKTGWLDPIFGIIEKTLMIKK